MRWQKLTLEEQRDVDKCKGLFESHYESLSQAYGETVTLSPDDVVMPDHNC